MTIYSLGGGEGRTASVLLSPRGLRKVGKFRQQGEEDDRQFTWIEAD